MKYVHILIVCFVELKEITKSDCVTKTLTTMLLGNTDGQNLLLICIAYVHIWLQHHLCIVVHLDYTCCAACTCNNILLCERTINMFIWKSFLVICWDCLLIRKPCFNVTSLRQRLRTKVYGLWFMTMHNSVLSPSIAMMPRACDVGVYTESLRHLYMT